MPECMAEDGQPAVFVGTFLHNGSSVAVCDEHMVYFCADTLHTMTGVDPAPFIAAISEDGPPTASASPGALPEEPSEPLDPYEVPGDPYEVPEAPEGDPGPSEEPEDPTPPTPPSGRTPVASFDPPTAAGNGSAKTTAKAASNASAR